MTMRAGRQSRNADFKNCGEAATTTLGPKGRQTYEPLGPKGPINPKPFFHNPSTQPAAPTAPLFGGEHSKPISRIFTIHMTQTANPVTLLASPLGEEGHEVAKGCTRVRMIMILDVDVTAERRHYNTHRPLKGKRLTTFCASLALLQNVFAVHRQGDTTTLGPKGRQT